mgnify:CR=1 FL=1
MAFENHYSKRKVSEIDPTIDVRVKIVGFIVDKKEDTLIIDDGSGKVKVFVDSPAIIENLSLNQLVRVFGSVLMTENGFEIKADMVQDLSRLDINLFKKVEELYNKVGV